MILYKILTLSKICFALGLIHVLYASLQIFYLFQPLEIRSFKIWCNWINISARRAMEEYIKKMDRTKEWGVNTILQALADVFLLQINIFNFVHSDIRPSNITIKSTENVVPKPFHIFLGFVGDFHTFSLRPLQWMSELPYSKCFFFFIFTSPFVNRKQIHSSRYTLSVKFN